MERIFCQHTIWSKSCATSATSGVFTARTSVRHDRSALVKGQGSPRMIHGESIMTISWPNSPVPQAAIKRDDSDSIIRISSARICSCTHQREDSASIMRTSWPDSTQAAMKRDDTASIMRISWARVGISVYNKTCHNYSVFFAEYVFTQRKNREIEWWLFC